MSEDLPEQRRILEPKAFGLKVVTMHLEGIGSQTIAKRLSDETGSKISFRAVNRLLKHPECQRIMEELNESLMATAKHLARQKGARLINEAMDVIASNLKKKNLNAVPYVFQLVGLDVVETKSNDTKIQIVFPSNDQPKQAVEVKSSEIDESSGPESSEEF